MSVRKSGGVVRAAVFEVHSYVARVLLDANQHDRFRIQGAHSLLECRVKIAVAVFDAETALDLARQRAEAMDRCARPAKKE